MRSTKVGGVPPAIPPTSPSTTRRPSPLNEGRGRTPGNPSESFCTTCQGSRAQRRPGAYPRQSRTVDRIRPVDRGAQRRPGAYPRQSSRRHLHRDPQCRRSTKAGGVPPAIPATPSARPYASVSLNEGRGRTPGNPWLGDVRPLHLLNRSTKAGGVPPAIPGLVVGNTYLVWLAQRRPGAYPRQSLPAEREQVRCDLRSTKAGGVPPAIPRTELPHEPQAEPRSTKAGGVPPAIPVRLGLARSDGHPPQGA